MDAASQLLRILRREIGGTLSQVESEIVAIKSEMETQKLNMFYNPVLRNQMLYAPEDEERASLARQNLAGKDTAAKEEVEALRSRLYELEMSVATQRNAAAASQARERDLLREKEEEIRQREERERAAETEREASLRALREELEKEREAMFFLSSRSRRVDGVGLVVRALQTRAALERRRAKKREKVSHGLCDHVALELLLRRLTLKTRPPAIERSRSRLSGATVVGRRGAIFASWSRCEMTFWVKVTSVAAIIQRSWSAKPRPLK